VEEMETGIHFPDFKAGSILGQAVLATGFAASAADNKGERSGVLPFVDGSEFRSLLMR